MADKVVSITSNPFKLTPLDKRKVIDECARLIEQVSPMEKRRDALKGLIASWHPELLKSPIATAKEEGDDYVIDIGVQAHETKITGIDRLYKLLTLKPFIRFVEMCRPTQKALDAALVDPKLKAPLDPALRSQFLSTTQTGSRRFSITKKFSEAA